MNKSKFLKKSLAMVLAVMLVVAMIPLGASAAEFQFTNDSNVVAVTSNAGKVTGDGAKGVTVTLPYNQTNDVSLAVKLNKNSGLDTVAYTVTPASGDETTGTVTADGSSNATLPDVKADTKKVTFYACNTAYANDPDDANGKHSETYTITLVKPAPSVNRNVKKALIGPAGSEITGTVNNASRTVVFDLPWGYDVTDGDNGKVTLEMEEPRLNGDGTEVKYNGTVTAIGADHDITIQTQNQHDDYTNYTVKTTEMSLLSSLTIGDTKAVLQNDKEKADYGEYFVTLPEDTKVDAGATKEKVKVSYTTVSNAGVRVIGTPQWGLTGNQAALTNGDEIKVAIGENLLTFTSNKGTTKEYVVHVAVASSKDATVKSFTAKATNNNGKTFTEDGVVNETASTLTVELPYKSVLGSVEVTLTTAAGSTVAAAEVGSGSAVTATTATDATGKTVFTLDMAKAYVITVTAADTKTVKYYRLSATTAASTFGKPAITGAKLTLGTSPDTVEYQGVIGTGVITFTVPYSTGDSDITADKLSWAKTPFTNITSTGNAAVIAAEPFKSDAENYITLQSDEDDITTYNLVFKKDAAKTGKAVTSFSFSTAATGDKVTAENTYKVSFASGKATLNLPYSFKLDQTKQLYPTFELSEGAKLYMNDTADDTAVAATALASGYNTTADPQAAKNPAITVAQLVKSTSPAYTAHFVVFDETAVVLIKNGETVPAIADLNKTASKFRGHVSVYEVDVKFADPQTGHTLTAFSADKNLVTSKIGATTIEITVPYSYAETGKPFFADFTASKLATVMGGADGQGTTFTGTPIAQAAEQEKTAVAGTTAGSLKVVKNGDAYELQVTDGTSFSKVGQICVRAERGDIDSRYDVTVKVAPAETGADITSLKINGVVASVNPIERTATVRLPFSSDITNATIDLEVSKLATPVNSLAASATTDKDGVKHYDVTDPFTITVTAEDGRTAKTFTVTVTRAEQFPDVPAGAYYHDDVYTAVANGIITGKPDGTFGPTEKITRRDFALMVSRMMGADVSSYTTTAFSDVANSDYAMKAIAYCSDKGIISGDGKGHFNPAGYITREQAAQMVANALKLEATTTSTDFKDNAAISSWAKAAVAACAEAGIIRGSTNGNYMPKANIQRCDAAAILVRALNK